MKYLVILFLFSYLPIYGQTYRQQIEKHIESYKQDFLNDERSPLKAEDLKDLHFFKIDESYCIRAKIELLPLDKILKIPTSGGQAKQFYRYAKATFNLKGKTFQLTLFKSEIPYNHPKYKDLLFLPFTDETNSLTTYGGGRYIDVYLTDIKDGWLTIDFNKAYNPYCAYTHGYQCPIPPEENDLAVAIKAGEKLFTGKKN